MSETLTEQQIRYGKYNIPLKFKKPKHLKYFENAEGLNSGEINEENPQQQIKTRPNTIQRYYNIENVKNALEVLNENYDTFRTIFKAPDDINVNYEVQQEAAGLILDLLNPNVISNPIHINKEKSTGKFKTKGKYGTSASATAYEPVYANNTSGYKSYVDYRYGTSASAKAYGEGFDEDEFKKHKGNWKQKNIEEFKELFDD